MAREKQRSSGKGSGKTTHSTSRVRVSLDESSFDPQGRITAENISKAADADYELLKRYGFS